MNDPAARPWWADVQHLRPREDRDGGTRLAAGADARTTRRFVRHTSEHRVEDHTAQDASVATLEHALPADPFTGEPDPWAAAAAELELEDALAKTPTWADDDWVVPEGGRRTGGGRRTIEIRGQVNQVAGVTAPAETAMATRSGRRRPSRTAGERLAGRPDRVAMWAFVLGVLLIVIAAFSQPGDAGAAAPASFAGTSAPQVALATGADAPAAP